MVKRFLSYIFEQFASKKRFYGALFLSTISGISYQGLNFIALIIVTRILGTESMGEFSLIQSGVMLMITFSIFGQNISATTLTSRFRLKYRNQIGRLIGNSYFLAIVFTLIVASIASFIPEVVFSDSIPDSIAGSFGVLIYSLWFIGMTVDMVQVSTLVGFEAYKDILRTDVTKGVFTLVVVVGLSYRFGLAGTIVGYTMAAWIGVLFNQLFVRRNLKLLNVSIDLKPRKELMISILKIGLPVSLAGLSVSSGIWVVNRLVIEMPDGQYALGIAFVCRQVFVFFQFIPNQISKVLLPIISGSDSTNDENIFRRTSIFLVTLVGFGLTIAGYLVEDLIMKIYNLDSVVSKWPLRIMIASILFSSYNSIMGQIVIARALPWLRTFADLVLTGTMVLVVILLNHELIMVLVPLSYLISYLLSNIFMVSAIYYNRQSFINLLRQ